jgi:hypothetical protein
MSGLTIYHSDATVQEYELVSSVSPQQAMAVETDSGLEFCAAELGAVREPGSIARPHGMRSDQSCACQSEAAQTLDVIITVAEDLAEQLDP